MSRPLVCECGACSVCRSRERMRLRRSSDPEHVRALDRARYERDKEKRQARHAAYLRTDAGRAAKNRAADAWAQRNPEKIQAQNIVSNAVRDGKITRQPCEICDEPKVDAHHADYSKPLEVQWLCRKHHAALHQMLRAFGAFAA